MGCLTISGYCKTTLVYLVASSWRYILSRSSRGNVRNEIVIGTKVVGGPRTRLSTSPPSAQVTVLNSKEAMRIRQT